MHSLGFPPDLDRAGEESEVKGLLGFPYFEGAGGQFSSYFIHVGESVSGCLSPWLSPPPPPFEVGQALGLKPKRGCLPTAKTWVRIPVVALGHVAGPVLLMTACPGPPSPGRRMGRSQPTLWPGIGASVPPLCWSSTVPPPVCRPCTMSVRWYGKGRKNAVGV